MISVDLTPVIQAAVGLAGITLTTLGGLVLNRLRVRYNLDISQQTQDAWNQGLSNAVQYGAQASLQTINQHGWMSADTHNAVLNSGLYYLVTHVPQTLKAVGLTPDLNDPINKQRITEALQRAMPAGLAVAASSPGTPLASMPSATTEHAVSVAPKPPPNPAPMKTVVR